ncbi:MAG: protein-glutamate methylesterase/protein-glutamine glutaminase [Thermodesulfobacteriota bacterium]
MQIKVLVVDDTIFYRKLLSDILKSLPEVQVVGTANNGKIALSRIRSLKPDLVTLDVEMPEMNGLHVLQAILNEGLQTKCLLVSSLTEKGGEITVQALQLGALDFITKPQAQSAEENMQLLQKALEPKIKSFIRHKKLWGGQAPEAKAREAKPARPARELEEVLAKSKDLEKRTEKSQAVAIGVSTGGPNALAALLPALKQELNVPVFVVQHMPPIFTASLAKSLDSKSPLRVKEAENGESVLPNTVYIAPGGKQMKVAGVGQLQDKVIRITDDPPENNCKPSVDFLLRSVAREYGSKSTAVIMTGMGQDGKLGAKVLKASGGVCIVQDEASSVVFGMPKSVIDAGLSDLVVPLQQLSREIAKTVL